jgi:hypothetical protein
LIDDQFSVVLSFADKKKEEAGIDFSRKTRNKSPICLVIIVLSPGSLGHA